MGHSEEHTANCSCWLTPQMSTVGCLKHFNCSLSPLNSGGEVTVICTQHRCKLNMQVTCFYFQTIISNLANKEWVLLHQQIPRLSCFIACKPNHLNWLCSHWQGKKLAIKLLYKVIAWLLAMFKLRLCQQQPFHYKLTFLGVLCLEVKSNCNSSFSASTRLWGFFASIMLHPGYFFHTDSFSVLNTKYYKMGTYKES